MQISGIFRQFSSNFCADFGTEEVLARKMAHIDVAAVAFDVAVGSSPLASG
jgi:hypothetical protein